MNLDFRSGAVFRVTSIHIAVIEVSRRGSMLMGEMQVS